MFVGPVSLLVAPEVVDGGGVIGIVIVGEAMTGDDDGGGAEAASARSLRRHATAAKAITTMTTAISAARARDLFTGRSPQGTRVLHRTPVMRIPIARRRELTDLSSSA